MVVGLLVWWCLVLLIVWWFRVLWIWLLIFLWFRIIYRCCKFWICWVNRLICLKFISVKVSYGCCDLVWIVIVYFLVCCGWVMLVWCIVFLLFWFVRSLKCVCNSLYCCLMFRLLMVVMYRFRLFMICLKFIWCLWSWSVLWLFFWCFSLLW